MQRDPLRAVTIGLCLWPFHSLGALGADVPRSDEATDYLVPELMANARPRWTPSRPDGAVAWGGFLIWPSATLGPLVESNPLQRHVGGRTEAGMHFAPRFLAERDSGVHSTTLYAFGGAKLYPGDSKANTLIGHVGGLHDWALRRDLIVRLQLDASRHADPFNNLRLIPGASNRDVLQESRGLASASVQKTFGRLFVVLSGTALRTSYDAREAKAETFLSDETVVTVKGRAGYWIGSSIYTFAEPSANWRTLDRGARRSNGTRVIAGLGTDRFGPIDAEGFIGRQEQGYPKAVANLSAVVAGGRLTWRPTPAWTAVAQLDQSLGQVAVGTIADPLGAPLRQNTAELQIRYAPSALWSAEATIGGVWLDYLGTAREDQLTFGGLRLDYALSRSIDLTAEVRSVRVDSTVALAAYRQTTGTLGATYHY